MKLTFALAPLLLLPVLATAAGAAPKVKTETVDYKQGDTVLEGFWAADAAGKGKRPAVIVVHEWKGPGPYVQMRAQQLAGLGYVAFAADVYGKGVRPQTHEEAGKVAGSFRADRKLMRDRIRAAYDLVKADPRVDPTKIAVIGYCFGGTAALELGRSGADVAGIATFHGALDTPTPADAKNIKARVIAFHGGSDKFVGPDAVAGFQKEMTEANVDWQMVVFGGAVHSFTVKDAGDDPSKGMAYNEKADLRSWAMLETFLADTLKGGKK